MKNKSYWLMWIILGFLTALILFSIIQTLKVASNSSTKSASMSATIKEDKLPIPAPILTPQPKIEQKHTSWTGKVSHYSTTGCLGCSLTMTMANGRPLDDDALTIAFNYLPLGSRVKLTNLDNGKSIVAEVTDTGGFTSLGRIADLTPKVASALESKTDLSTILIEQL